MAKREHPRYENTEWPDYEFREYPKMVYPGATDPTKPYGPNGKPLKGILVHNAEEEAVALGLEDDGEESTPASGATATKEGAPGAARRWPPRPRRGAHAHARGREGRGHRRGRDPGRHQFDKAWSLARILDAIDTYKAENTEPVV
jgi:hypothetical protein